MRKYNEVLIKAYMEGKKSITCGNHKLITENDLAYFCYHGQCILQIDKRDNVIIFNNCGYNTSSTTQAINGYIEAIKYFEPINYMNCDLVDLSQGKKFENKIKKTFDRKIVLNEEEIKSLQEINNHFYKL